MARVQKSAGTEHERKTDIEALCEHLRQIGLDATVESKKSKTKLGGVHLLILILGSVRIVNRNIDLVELELELMSTEDSGYRCNYVVQAKVNGLEDRLKTKLKVVRKGFWRREVVGFRWEGKELAQVLNGDANLRDKQLIYLPDVRIKPDKKRQCIRMWGEDSPYNTPELAFPTIETFEAFDRIAHHIRSIARVK